MEFKVEKTISNFVESQFPQFYQEEGPKFIQFVRAYYEWLESAGPVKADGNGGPIHEARELTDYRDIDTTVERFLEYFQKKYLYGIPFNIIANKRFLLKHILDVYRSKTTIQGYKLLFRLIYDEDVDIYLPGKDVLRVSDGKWVDPRYLEVTYTENLESLIGKSIMGVSSKTTAVVEKVVRERVNKDIVYMAYITSVEPKGGEFDVGERIVDYRYRTDSAVIGASPVILGSLDTLDVFNSGNSFNVGDILKIAYKDPDTNEIDSFGIEGLVIVKSLFRGYGSLNFNIVNGGFGFLANSAIFLYKNIADQTGSGASFNIKLSDTRRLTYNTDWIQDFIDLPINETSYGFLGNASANLSTNIEDTFTYESGVFGKIAYLTNVLAGNAYIAPANVFIRSTYRSKNLPGKLWYYNTNTFINAYSSGVYVNTSFIDGNVVLIANANKHFDLNSYVDYLAPEGYSAITGLQSNTRYYVKTTNTSGITLSETPGGATLAISTTNVSSNVVKHVFTTKALTKSFLANASYINNVSHSILVSNANTYFFVDDYVYYYVPTGNVAITGLKGNTYYYVESSNDSALTLSMSVGGDPIEVFSGNYGAAAETHYLLNDTTRAQVPYVNAYSEDFYSNTTSVNNSNYSILLANADIYLQAGDSIFYDVPTGSSALANLTANSVYFVKTVNSSAITLSNTAGGATIQIYTSSSSAAASHQIKGAKFNKYFANNDVIYLQSDEADANTLELAVIREIKSDTSVQLYGFTNNTSTNSMVYGRAVVIMPSQFANSEVTARNSNTGLIDQFSLLSYNNNPNNYGAYASIMRRLDNTINGINDNILALNSSGNNIVEKVAAVSSGRAYVEGESVHAYRYGILEVPVVVKGGFGYVNNDTLIFTGGFTEYPARGSVITNNQGHITAVNTQLGAWYSGSGYNTIPEISIRSANSRAYGAVLTTNFIPFDTASEIRGIVRKAGVGKGVGYWATTDGLLNSDKVIQDSYYYQDYSYEIRAAISIENYKEVFYSTFHPAGTELFGKYELQPFVVQSEIDLVYDTNANTAWPLWLTCDISDPRIRCDVLVEELPDGRLLPNTYLTVDQFTFANNYLGVDINTIFCSNATLRVDRISEDS
jgi:hypothetical protein